MSILPAQTIEHLCVNNMMVQPFKKRSIHESGLSSGLSYAGLDITLDQDVTLYPVTLKNLVLSSVGIKKPSFSLASTQEKFRLPNDVIAFVTDKSTWARVGLALQNTVIEPGFNGYITLELSNHGPDTIRLIKGMPIAQIIFHFLHAPTELLYCGKYNNAPRGPQKAIFERISTVSNTIKEPW